MNTDGWGPVEWVFFLGGVVGVVILGVAMLCLFAIWSADRERQRDAKRKATEARQASCKHAAVRVVRNVSFEDTAKLLRGLRAFIDQRTACLECGIEMQPTRVLVELKTVPTKDEFP